MKLKFCINCRKDFDGKGREVCPKCSQIKRREVAKIKGLCITCMKNKAISSQIECLKCSTAGAVRKRIRSYEAKKTAFDHMGSQCFDCGYDKEFYSVYEFHHLDPLKKEIELSSNLKSLANWEKVKKELEGCIMLCCLCHRIRHFIIDQEEFRELVILNESLK